MKWGTWEYQSDVINVEKPLPEEYREVNHLENLVIIDCSLLELKPHCGDVVGAQGGWSVCSPASSPSVCHCLLGTEPQLHPGCWASALWACACYSHLQPAGPQHHLCFCGWSNLSVGVRVPSSQACGQWVWPCTFSHFCVRGHLEWSLQPTEQVPGVLDAGISFWSDWFSELKCFCRLCV